MLHNRIIALGTSQGAATASFFATSRPAIHLAQLPLISLEFMIEMTDWIAWAAKACVAGVERLVVGLIGLEGFPVRLEGAKTTGSTRLVYMDAFRGELHRLYRLTSGIVAGLVRFNGKTLPFAGEVTIGCGWTDVCEGPNPSKNSSKIPFGKNGLGVKVAGFFRFGGRVSDGAVAVVAPRTCFKVRSSKAERCKTVLSMAVSLANKEQTRVGRVLLTAIIRSEWNAEYHEELKNTSTPLLPIIVWTSTRLINITIQISNVH